VILSGLILAPATAAAADRCERPLGHIASIEGDVDVVPGGESPGVPVHLGQALCPGDVVRTGARSRAAVRFTNDGTFRLDQNTTLVLHAPAEPERSSVEVLRGLINFFSPRRRSLTVSTAFLNGGVEGTEFAVRVDADEAEIILFAGEVVADNPLGRVEMAPGEAVTAARGGPLVRRLVARPRDAVAWALHYPPVLSVPADGTATSAMALPGPLIEAYAVGGRGDVAGAFAALDRVPEKDRTAAFHVYRAALLLDVGRLDEARADIDRALVLDDGAAAAWSLKAIIAVAGNDREGALADSERAVAADPRSGTARIARSYALQADFRLEDARDELQRAVLDNPENALAWSRLAEMWLALGYRGRSREAADRAVALDPNSATVQTVRGFAALSQFAVSRAASTFAQAIVLDNSAPLPRLGLGLATINSGDLAAGRGDLETAVALDPGNALLRSYLGKAYFEEKRDDLAAREFAIAKDLDPNDPTPFLYDAIRLQTENRPVEALGELQHAITLNDNRAVFRGRLLLDQDHAAQAASLARIYTDLGFDQLGAEVSSRALASDPGNAAAHRFRADLYASGSNQETTRVSELLQAQMLQTINLNPIQPSLADIDLSLAARGGPTVPGLNEYNALFQRNQGQLSVAGIAGNMETLGGEAIVSGIYDGFSASAGQFHYQTIGFRENADIRHENTDIFVQMAVTPELNAQAEYRRRDTKQGDITLNFDPSFDSDVRQQIKQDTGRFGIRYAPSSGHDVLASFIISERVDDQRNISNPFGLTNRLLTADMGYQVEAQYFFGLDPLSIVAGVNYYFVKSKLEINSFSYSLSDHFESSQRNGYLYANLNFPRSIFWTTGFNVVDFSEDQFSFNEFDPKFGVQWSVFDMVSLRAAYFETAKPKLVVEQTLEPTQVAGFNQFFDDVNGTRSKRYGIGLDLGPWRGVSTGVEASRRHLDVPFSFPAALTLFQYWQEDLYRGYVYWTPAPRWALSSEIAYEVFDADTDFDAGLPQKVWTLSVPAAVTYFDPSGFFATAGITYVYQRVRLSPSSSFGRRGDAFVLFDGAIGFRFPGRRGSISLVARNLFDERFLYQDSGAFRTNRRVAPAFIPAQSLLGQVSLVF
jgi:tetratricopeptide (TPR) repeat protein